jgi:flagellin-like protein
MRKGLTPIVGIVLMLAITLAIAGVAALWIQSIISGSQAASDRDRNTIPEILNLVCNSNGAGTDTYNIAFRNSGTVEIDTSSVTMIVKDFKGTVVHAQTITNFGGSAVMLPGAQNFSILITATGGTANVLSKGAGYRVELRFPQTSKIGLAECTAT